MVHAGDFIHTRGVINNKDFRLMTKEHRILGEKIFFTQVAELSEANEESVKRVGGTVGWGLAGAAVLGPVGLLAGLLLGGRGKDITFVAKLKDGRKFMATTSLKNYTRMQAAIF